jgi:hypothetical protein
VGLCVCVCARVFSLITQINAATISPPPPPPLTLTQDDVLTVDTTTGALTPNNVPFPGTGFLNTGIATIPKPATSYNPQPLMFLNTGVATTDGATIFLLFGQDPTQVGVCAVCGMTPMRGM